MDCDPHLLTSKVHATRDLEDEISTEPGPRWRPISLTIPFLTVVIILPIGLIAVLLYLAARSNRDAGIVFFDNIGDVSVSTQFLFLYLPTIIAVIYSLLWAWIDLDIRRLEPYYQLSKSAGATGKQSILLHYPVDILASVPIKALKLGSVCSHSSLNVSC